ncbi:MAG: flavodoxin family protein [Rhodobacteraceae bacterium]|nr:flavodoxin family protein [Paracoccaceae bacterium]
MFFSGSGSTALIAELIAGRLAARGHDAPLLSVEQNSDPGLLGACDLAVIGTPTYHNCPAGTLLDWIARWPPGAGPARAFLFATFGLYTGNARICWARRWPLGVCGPWAIPAFAGRRRTAS